MFRRNFLVNSVGDSRLDPVGRRKWKNQLNRGDLSAKGRLPDVYLLTKISLIYCHRIFLNFKKFQKDYFL
jgi:hypothetical protein